MVKNVDYWYRKTLKAVIKTIIDNQVFSSTPVLFSAERFVNECRHALHLLYQTLKQSKTLIKIVEKPSKAHPLKTEFPLLPKVKSQLLQPK